MNQMTRVDIGSAAMRDRTINLPNFENVTAGQDATARLVLDHTYHELQAHCLLNGSAPTVAEMKAMFEECSIEINGSEVSNFNVEDYLTHLQKEGYVFTDGVFPIMFRNQLNARVPENEILTSLGTIGLNQVTIVLRVAATATAPQIKRLKARVGPNTVPSLFMAFKTRTLSGLNTGDNDLTDIDMSQNNGDLMSLDFATSDMQEINITYKDRIIEADKDPVQINHELQNTAVAKTPQAGYTHVDFCADGKLTSALTAQGGELQMRLKMASDGAVRVLDKRLVSINRFAQKGS